MMDAVRALKADERVSLELAHLAPLAHAGHNPLADPNHNGGRHILAREWTACLQRARQLCLASWADIPVYQRLACAVFVEDVGARQAKSFLADGHCL
eukprot:CAMPEP_0119411034 /NCGR_PEP_ID=MMETSP1335-20130426/3889_1 /TAXON_ID=259385 /ORGANISM="Chrysoculter rhomboideus, Strain RCC1486" /LENGTH=96 /DNA_ID=CAMNT_0007435643 /DNA_START=391 /DNA_END=681 /DNA_ORIENTATION=+